MNFFKGLFGKENNIETEEGIWKTLDSEEQLKAIIKQSFEKPVAIFKHSTRCSISTMAMNRIDRSWDIPQDVVDLYYLDLIAYRPVSNKIAQLLEVQHESPQIILVKDGKAIYHTSHSDISTEGVKGYV
ncbi:MAG: bacillithiol system redox-active protein YtxJ [Bacteroidota bacterium]